MGLILQIAYGVKDYLWFEDLVNARKIREIFFVEDLLLVPLYLLFIYLFLKYKQKQQPESIRHYFLRGYYVKIIGLIFFIVYLKYISDSGADSFGYYWAGNQIYNLFKIDPITSIRLIFSSSSQINEGYISLPLSEFIFTQNEALICKISGFFSLLSFSSYIVLSLLLSLFCYGGIWKIFKTLVEFYPTLRKPLAFSTIFIPSLCFWSSALSKEIVCIGALGYLFDSTIQLFIRSNDLIKNSMIIIFMSFLLINIKVYIIIAFGPAILLLILMLKISNLKSRFLRLFSGPIFVIILVLLLIIIYINSGNALDRFSLDVVLENAKITYEYLSKEGFAESRYDLGTLEPTIEGVSKLAPAAINVTLFRPYLWESNKLIILVASVESTIFLILTLYVIFKVGIYRTLNNIFKDPIIMFSVAFALIFSLAVGLTSGNFGTLMRYKIPMMPFYLSALVIIYFTRTKFKKQNIYDTNVEKLQAPK